MERGEYGVKSITIKGSGRNEGEGVGEGRGKTNRFGPLFEGGRCVATALGTIRSMIPEAFGMSAQVER